MTTCEGEVDVSFLDSSRAADLSDATACPNVGEARHALDRQLKQRMLSELCEDDDDSSNDEEVGASIFDYSSPMGLIPDESGDYWVRDSTTATWTRLITVPRREFYYPNEGERGPGLSILRSTRLTIPRMVKSIKDDWRKTVVEDGPTAPLSEEL